MTDCYIKFLQSAYFLQDFTHQSAISMTNQHLPVNKQQIRNQHITNVHLRYWRSDYKKSIKKMDFCKKA